MIARRRNERLFETFTQNVLPEIFRRAKFLHIRSDLKHKSVYWNERK